MSGDLQIRSEAAQLPGAWDQLSPCYFQQREFLTHTEKYNPCGQRYYLFYKNGALLAGAVAYTLRLDVLTFLRIPSPLRMNIVGIPCSVSSPGIFGAEGAVRELKRQIYRREKGFCLFLNLLDDEGAPGLVGGPTLPAVIFRNSFSNWEAYLAGLRAPYRRRLHRILEKGKDLTMEQLPCRAFTSSMYAQYLAVFQRSKDKLEQLQLPFFRHLPDPFRLHVARRGEELLGWAITLQQEDQYYFFLGGIDYQANEYYGTYFQLLITILKAGIELGVDSIDLGQTAEIPKMRLGGYCEPRFLEGRHRNRLIQPLLKAAAPWLVYRREVPEVHVFKDPMNTRVADYI